MRIRLAIAAGLLLAGLALSFHGAGVAHFKPARADGIAAPIAVSPIGGNAEFAYPPAAAISLVSAIANGPTCANPCGTGTTVLNGTVAGHVIIVGVFYCESNCNNSLSTTVSSVQINNGGGNVACSQVPSAASAVPGVAHSDVWYCTNIAGGNETVTVTYSATTAWYPITWVSEWAGINNASPIDNIGAGYNNASTTSVSISTSSAAAAAGELIYSIERNYGNNFTVTAGVCCTTAGLGGIVVSDHTIDEYQISSSAAVQTNTYTIATADAVVGSIAAFKH